LVPGLVELRGYKTALDVGCGVGEFSRVLASMGLDVSGVDVRRENVAEARDRFPDLAFRELSVEADAFRGLGSFDLVLCFGLLYHLENPFAAIRNLFAVTKSLLIVESQVIPETLPSATLVDEGEAEDQSLHYVAFVPSEACLVKMLYRAGFTSVFRPRHLPEHPDFKRSPRSQQRRTVLTAARAGNEPAHDMRLVHETSARGLWDRGWRQVAALVRRRLVQQLGAGARRTQKPSGP
jgi:SAM-dependent methyltransferase